MSNTPTGPSEHDRSTETEFYRSSSVGVSLTKTLNTMILDGDISTEVAMKIIVSGCVLFELIILLNVYLVVFVFM